MPGPNSSPNGDTRVMRGHIDEVFVCVRHGERLDSCKNDCNMVPLRWYLAERNRLRTGKTK